MKKLKNWFLRNFVCETIFSKGHIPVKEVRETFFCITQHKCERCDCTLGIGNCKHVPDPPNSTPEQLKDWHEWKEKRFERLRKGITEYESI